MSTRFGSCLAALAAILLAVLMPHGAGAQEPEPSPASDASQLKASEIREFLATRLGVSVEQLSDKTDLLRDLGLDAGDVVETVAELFARFSERPADQMQLAMTEVGTIIRAATVVRRSWVAARAGDKEFFVQPVYFATDRKAAAPGDPETAFGIERARNGVISYGRAEVNIPASHVAGRIERPSWLTSALHPKHHIFVRTVEGLAEAAFFNATAGASETDILVFIHGFNVSFGDALRRTAQISVDFEFPGTAVAFTWPSYNKVTSYTADWENANWAQKHVEVFLERLATSARANGRKVHVIAHSMGNKVLLGALRLLAYRGFEDLFQSVVLCAPDFDAGMFREQLAAEIKPLGNQWVVYASEHDLALRTSENITTLRLGKPITPAEGYEIIDASTVEVSPWSVPETHSYFAEKEKLINDLKGVIKGLAADARGLVVKPNPDGMVWTFER